MTDTTSSLSDAEFVRRFEMGELTADSFHHREHLRLTWIYLRQYPSSEAIARVSSGIRRFAASLGKSERYHETITWAYVLLVNERMARDGASQEWNEFARENPDLLDWKNSILSNYYSSELLESELAKRVFVFPDRVRPS